ncbi:hypothetical protein [Aureibacter tunicatorum]|uniref:Outer membrane repeat protein n=1 Tax=Aureibacter tunicatorum TaxID=866807 RepID=A0AAE4BSH7_9BACT|nr:hypothetical protein [Aureibacter tunicatorum]MDR6238422.1 putative outer membrane repeat protein [Aureibacter tunicatorum]BDD03454.1 hypothetical protein AUTU_09370 [Aureibacter tunicatorum]
MKRLSLILTVIILFFSCNVKEDMHADAPQRNEDGLVVVNKLSLGLSESNEDLIWWNYVDGFKLLYQIDYESQDDLIDTLLLDILSIAEDVLVFEPFYIGIGNDESALFILNEAFIIVNGNEWDTAQIYQWRAGENTFYPNVASAQKNITHEGVLVVDTLSLIKGRVNNLSPLLNENISFGDSDQGYAGLVGSVTSGPIMTSYLGAYNIYNSIVNGVTFGLYPSTNYNVDQIYSHTTTSFLDRIQLNRQSIGNDSSINLYFNLNLGNNTGFESAKLLKWDRLEKNWEIVVEGFSGGPFKAVQNDVYKVILVEDNIIYVDLNANGDNDGTSWENAYDDLQTGINTAVSRANTNNKVYQIWIAEGEYKPASSFSITGDDIELYGGFEGNEFLISQRDIFANQTILKRRSSVSNRLMNYSAGSNAYLKFDGLYFIDGTGSQAGGVRVASNADFESCHFEDNEGLDWGGAVYIGSYASEVNFEDCVFEDNSSRYQGGAIYLQRDNTQLNITNCQFIDNNSDAGGAISNASGSMNIINTAFDNNVSRYGGGIYQNPGNGSEYSIVDNCSFADHEGSAIYVNTTSINVRNSSFKNNESYGVFVGTATDYPPSVIDLGGNCAGTGTEANAQNANTAISFSNCQ